MTDTVAPTAAAKKPAARKPAANKAAAPAALGDPGGTVHAAAR